MQKLVEERLKKLESMKGLKGPYSIKIADNYTGIWRKERPVIDNELCIKCNICAIYCPIGAIEKNENMDIDYNYCKGCGICEEVCPKDAIDLVDEKNFEEGEINMGDILALDGNAAIAYGVMKSKVELIAAYPITPQTPIVENLSSLVDRGEFDCAYINVESEHSALSALIGASATGVRTFTASASHGLALMHEVTGVASGSRLPIVMGVVSRALPSPCSLWCDHSDIMTQRDQGWIQLFAKNPQEALDFIMIAYTVSEDERVLTPTMVDIDGFYVSHLTEPVNVPTDEEAGKFIGKFEPNNLILDVNNPYAINNLSSPEIFTEYKYSQKLGMDAAIGVIEERFEKFNEVFGRKYSLVESYYTEDAETVIVCLGSMSGTVLHTVKELRKLGKKVGLVRVVSFRPFPKEALAVALKGINNVAVIDRVSSVGSMGPLYEEVLSCIHQTDEDKKNVFSFVAGLGGRDINEKTVKSVFEYVDNANEIGIKPIDTIWIDLKKE